MVENEEKPQLPVLSDDLRLPLCGILQKPQSHHRTEYCLIIPYWQTTERLVQLIQPTETD